MGGLVDSDAVLLDLRGRLRERPSWGAPQLRELLDELEQTHRIHETAEHQMLRRFSGHLTDSFLGLLPTTSATTDPLAADDPTGTSDVMVGGATSDDSREGTHVQHHEDQVRRAA